MNKNQKTQGLIGGAIGLGAGIYLARKAGVKSIGGQVVFGLLGMAGAGLLAASFKGTGKECPDLALINLAAPPEGMTYKCNPDTGQYELVPE